MKRLLAASLALAMSPATFAASMGSVDVFYIPKADLDIAGPLGDGSDDGDGFGAKGMFTVLPNVAVTGEYRTISTDDFDVDYDQFRIGGMYLIQGQSGVGLEYVNGTADLGGDADITGFLLNGRLAGEVTPQISLYGQIGYLLMGEQDLGDLGGPDEDAKGLEFGVGGVYSINKQFGVLVDWRRSKTEGDDSELELEFTDIAIGARINL